MKTIAALISCALLAAACNEDRPARDPSRPSDSNTTSTTGASPNDDNVKTVAPPTDESRSASAPSTIGTTTTNPNNLGPSSTTGERDLQVGGPRADVPPVVPTPSLGTDPSAPGPKADNTKRNEKDRRPSMTPMDQNNGKGDLEITAAIRRQLVSAKDLSFNAKNAKVITAGSKVTLRGPVKTDEEKARIEGVARATPGVTEVDNQLEVKK